MKMEARRIVKFIETFSPSFADVEIRSIMNPAVCAGWVVDFFKHLDFEGFKMSKVVGNWEQSSARAGDRFIPVVRMIYVNENNEILLLTAKVDDNFVAGFFELLKGLVAEIDRRDSECLSDYFEAESLCKVEEFSSMTDFALQVGEIGKLLLKTGNYKGWVDWSRWIIQLVKVLKVKELKTLARAVRE